MQLIDMSAVIFLYQDSGICKSAKYESDKIYKTIYCANQIKRCHSSKSFFPFWFDAEVPEQNEVLDFFNLTMRSFIFRLSAWNKFPTVLNYLLRSGFDLLVDLDFD